MAKPRRWTTVTAAAAGTAAALAAAYGITAVANRRASQDVSLQARIEVGTQPTAVAVDKNGVWVTVSEGLVHVTPEGMEPDRTIEGPDAFAFSYLDASAGALWIQQGGVSTTAPLALVGVDPATGAARTIAAAKEEPHGIAHDRGALWAVDIAGNVVKVDAATGEELARTNLGTPLWAVAVGAGAVWVGGEAGVARLDPATGKVVARIEAPNTVDLAVGHGFVWAAGADAPASLPQAGPASKGKLRKALGSGVPGVARIDPRTNTVAGHTPLSGAAAVAVGDDAVWVVSHFDSTLSRLDASTGAVEQTIQVGPNPLADVAVAHGAVWVTEGTAEGALLRYA